MEKNVNLIFLILLVKKNMYKIYQFYEKKKRKKNTKLNIKKMRDNYYRFGEGFLIVYSITMRDTFVATNRFYDHILQVKGKDEVWIILLINLILLYFF